MEKRNIDNDANFIPDFNEELLGKQIERAVEGIEKTSEDALAPQKEEIGKKVFSEYENLYSKQKELEEKLAQESGEKNYHQELREDGADKPLRIKEDERKKPRTLKENIALMREDKGKKEEIEKELQSVNEKINIIENNDSLKKIFVEKKNAEMNMSTALSGELIEGAEKENTEIERKIGNMVLEKYKSLEKDLNQLKQKLIDHENKKPKIENREANEIVGLRKEQRKWQKEKEEIEKEIEAVKEKLAKKELLDILIEKNETIREVLEINEEDLEEEIEIELSPEAEAETNTTPPVENSDSDARNGSIRGKIMEFFSLAGSMFMALLYTISSLIEKITHKGKK